MSEYRITLPDGTVVEGDSHTEVHRLATAARTDMYLREDGAYYEYEEAFFDDNETITDIVARCESAQERLESD